MIYSGSAFPEWVGDAFVPALSGQSLIRVDIDGTSATAADQWSDGPLGERLREVEQGPDGTIWVLQDGGGGKSPARWAYERVLLYIRNFEEQLGAGQEVAMGFAGSDAGVLRIEGLGYFDPDILTFYGRGEDGLRSQIIQHVTQLNVLLRAVPAAAPEDPPRRIGFRLAAGLEDEPAPQIAP